MATTKEVLIPDIGDFSNVDVIEVLVSAGDRINAEDPLVTLESDKATMDVPAPYAGIVKELKINVGDKVGQGTPIVLMELEDMGGSDGGSTVAAPDETRDVALAVTPAVTPSEPTQADREPEPAPQTSAAVTTAKRTPPPSLPPPMEKSGGARPHASPSVRAFARELGADLTQIRGTGPKGRIL